MAALAAHNWIAMQEFDASDPTTQCSRYNGMGCFVKRINLARAKLVGIGHEFVNSMCSEVGLGAPIGISKLEKSSCR
jgi:hypothetical protein